MTQVDVGPNKSGQLQTYWLFKINIKGMPKLLERTYTTGRLLFEARKVFEQLSEDLGPYSGTLLDIKVLNYDGTEIPLTPAGCIRIYLLDMSIHDKEHPFIVEVNEYFPLVNKVWAYFNKTKDDSNHSKDE